MLSAPMPGCVVLAAGLSRRFGGNKLELPFMGEALFQRALTAVPTDAYHPVVVVTRFGTVQNAAGRQNFLVVRNKHPEAGQSLSVRLGLDALGEVSGALFLPADQPLLQSATLRRMAVLHRQQPDAILALSFHGKRGAPCLFPASLFKELRTLSGDTGGRVLLTRHPERIVLCEAGAPEELWDVDTPEALEKLKRLAENGNTL